MSPALKLTGMMLATTVGAGLFAMPFVFRESGWLLSFMYLVSLAGVVNWCHRLFARTLKASSQNDRLMGLVALNFGPTGRLFGLLAIPGGLVFTLVVYLILGGEFLNLVHPLGGWAWPAFWIISSLPILIELKKIFASETIGALCIFLIVLAIFVGGFRSGVPSLAPVIWPNILFPLGAILFALSGWPAVKPILEHARKEKIGEKDMERAMNRGTWLAALIYALFALGILASTTSVAPNALDSLGEWPVWAVATLATLGLFALWTSYVPVGLELRNSLMHDLRWSPASSAMITLFLPPILLAIGLSDFIVVIGFIGGVFLASEYILILRLAQKALRLKAGEIFMSLALMLLFAIAAVYELYYFIVK
jgi:amino acid permease